MGFLNVTSTSEAELSGLIFFFNQREGKAKRYISSNYSFPASLKTPLRPQKLSELSIGNSRGGNSLQNALVRFH